MNHSLRALIVFNPNAGQAEALYPQLEAAAEVWRTGGWQVELRPTRCAGDATEIARQAANEGYDVVAAAGGDGTVNEVVNGLVGTQTALATLPCGTINIWAREIGLSMDIPEAAKAFLTAERRSLDLGLCYPYKDKRTRKKEKRKAQKEALKCLELSAQSSDAQSSKSVSPHFRADSRPGTAAEAESTDEKRHFLLMASAGFDAAVTAEVNLQEKRRFGAAAYLKSAAQLALDYQGTKTKLYIDGKRIRGRTFMAVIGNSQLYGGVVKFTAHALVDDGLLDVCVIKGRSLWMAPLRLFSVFARFYNVDSQVRYYRAKKVEIRGKKKKKRLPVQVDGDYLGETPRVFEVLPQGLWALVPTSCDPSLWSKTDQEVDRLDRLQKTAGIAS